MKNQIRLLIAYLFFLNLVLSFPIRISLFLCLRYVLESNPDVIVRIPMFVLRWYFV